MCLLCFAVLIAAALVRVVFPLFGTACVLRLVPCCVVLCCVLLCFAVLCCAVPACVTLCVSRWRVVLSANLLCLVSLAPACLRWGCCVSCLLLVLPRCVVLHSPLSKYARRKFQSRKRRGVLGCTVP